MVGCASISARSCCILKASCKKVMSMHKPNTLAFYRKACLLYLCAVLLLLPDVVATSPARAQILGAAERAAARAAARRAERAAVERSLARSESGAAGSATRRQAADVVVRRWSNPLCGRSRPCPLPEGAGNSFRGGSYNEVVLGRDTTFYRVYSRPEFRYGEPGKRYSYWSRSDARGTRAIIDFAIPVSSYGNTAWRRVAVTLPKGTRVYEGNAGPWRTKIETRVGGGNQVVIQRSSLPGAAH